AGAAALIVSDPVAAGVEDLGSLAARAGTVPVLIDRPRLRPDVADDVSAVPVAARMLAADVAADAAHVWAAVRDAVGWMRILAGAPLVLRSAEASALGAVALLEEPVADVAAAVVVAVSAERAETRVRAQLLGETRVEVDVDAAVGTFAVDVSTAEGTRRLPRRHEMPERLMLRRAIAAIETGAPLADLADLRHDVALTAQLLRTTGFG
ncbi:MAG: hypothetical protein K0Q58_934, partial [Microbacterium sp.]|nr:hypothetical protein [Microbacterium sp.]